MRGIVGAVAAVMVVAACEKGPAKQTGTATDSTAAANADGNAPLPPLADIGLSHPESVLYDSAADVLYVSNINGDPGAHDDNGFIARLGTDGTVQQLKWIDGASPDFVLDAPKGMTLSGDTLFVADIDTVRAFSRTTGRPITRYGIRGAGFLNDIDHGGDGALYVTDSGADKVPPGATGPAVYRLVGGRATVISRGQILNPNGVVAVGDSLFVAGMGGTVIFRTPATGGNADPIASVPGGQLDGLLRLPDGTFAVTSWQTQSVYRVAATATSAPSVLASGLEGPADMGFDTRRSILYVPQLTKDRIARIRVK